MKLRDLEKITELEYSYYELVEQLYTYYLIVFENDFKFIKWEDEEPFNIKQYLENQGIEV